MTTNSQARTLVQCDFDGTITAEDQSFLLLDAFAQGDWRFWLRQYRDGRITVGRFNTEAFALVKAERQVMIDYVKRYKKLRPGFKQLVDYCVDKGHRLVIVSNGLDFYIDAILQDYGFVNLEVFAARTKFGPGGLDVRYVSPDGSTLDDGFKEAYSRYFRNLGYRLIYLGNGPSDLPAAMMADKIFATEQLLTRCQHLNIKCFPFQDLNDVVRGLESLQAI